MPIIYILLYTLSGNENFFSIKTFKTTAFGPVKSNYANLNNAIEPCIGGICN